MHVIINAENFKAKYYMTVGKNESIMLLTFQKNVTVFLTVKLNKGEKH
jgi:hypothetical protein